MAYSFIKNPYNQLITILSERAFMYNLTSNIRNFPGFLNLHDNPTFTSMSGVLSENRYVYGTVSYSETEVCLPVYIVICIPALYGTSVYSWNHGYSEVRLRYIDSNNSIQYTDYCEITTISDNITNKQAVCKKLSEHIKNEYIDSHSIGYAMCMIHSNNVSDLNVIFNNTSNTFCLDFSSRELQYKYELQPAVYWGTTVLGTISIYSILGNYDYSSASSRAEYCYRDISSVNISSDSGNFTANVKRVSNESGTYPSLSSYCTPPPMFCSYAYTVNKDYPLSDCTTNSGNTVSPAVSSESMLGLVCILSPDTYGIDQTIYLNDTYSAAFPDYTGTDWSGSDSGSSSS